MSYVAWSVIFSLFCLVGSALIHYYYAKTSYKLFPIATNFFICFSVFICVLPFPLLVLDVDAALASTHAGETENSASGFFRPIWVTIVMLTQLLAWIVLPIAQEYDIAGEFTVQGRMTRALKENIKLYVVLGVVVGILLGYIIFLKGLTSFTSIVSLVLAAANAFGLLLIVIFLASGLVGVPRTLWRLADPSMVLRYYYYHATEVQEDLDLAAMDLAEIKVSLMALDPRVTEEDRFRLGHMLELISEADRDIPMYHKAASRVTVAPTNTDDDDVSRAHLVALHVKLKKAIKTATKQNYMWDSTVRNCLLLDAIIHGRTENLSQFQIVYHKSIRKPLFRCLAVISFILTILVLWSELVLPFQSMSSTPLSVVEIVAQSPGIHFIGSTMFLFHMAACSYWATFQFKVFDIFHVLPSVSDATSLCFTATFLTRLIMPLCYNFLWIAALTETEKLVTYSSVFGKMDVVDFLGKWFNQFIPVLIPIVATLIELKVFDKILLNLGIDRHDPGDTESSAVKQKIHDGQRLLTMHVGQELSSGTSPVAASSTGDGTAAGASSSVQGNISSGATNNKAQPGKRYAEYKAKKAMEAAV